MAGKLLLHKPSQPTARVALVLHVSSALENLNKKKRKNDELVT